MAGGGGGGQQGQHSGSEATVFAVLLLLGGAVFLIWTRLRIAVVWPVYGLDWVQYKLIDLIGLLDAGGRSKLAYLTWCLLGKYDPATVSWEEIMVVQADLAGRTRIVYATLVAVLAMVVTFRMKGSGFRNQFTLTGRAYETVHRFMGKRVPDKWVKRIPKFIARRLFKSGKEWVAKGTSFVHYQASHWRVTLAGAHFDPDRDDPVQQRQMSPLEWMRHYKIGLTKKEGLDAEAATVVFARQLGSSWQGVRKAPYYVQAICVMAALNARRDGRLGALRDRLTEVHVLQPAKAEALSGELLAPFLGNADLTEAIDKYGSKHAFMNTAVIGIYGAGGPMAAWGGGEAGVLSTSMFRWLKPLDRTLWYCLNNVGRRAFHIEGAGGVSHFQAERILQQPLADPYVDGAIEGLESYLEEAGVETTDIKKKRKF